MGNNAHKILVRRLLGDTALNTTQKADIPLFLAQQEPSLAPVYTKIK